ncbi:MAG TPA: hypothetical protein VGH89_39415 [Pseudonocardia sp.]
MPGIVPMRRYVATGPAAAVMLLEVRAYSQGCLLEFVVAARPPATDQPVFTVECADGANRVVRALDGHRLWISPLPPVTGFTLVTAWAERGISDQRTALPGDTVRQAAWDSFPCLPAGL